MRLFLGAFPAFLILWQTSVYVEELFDNRQRRVEAMEAVRHAHDLLGHTLQSFAADVKILSKDRELRRLASGDGTAVQEVAKQFVIFASEKPFIAQLRYLDRAGNEVVRVDRRGADIRIANQADLQNKAGRYYFWQTIGLSEGALYVSAIDLNIENGEIEVPWNAMLRRATPIRPASQGATAGIVIVNISADSFIGEIERARPSNGEPIQLLNDKGYWLAGVPREQLWGFMFGRDTTMAITDPDAWRRISASSNGYFDGDGGHYVFQTLHPASYLSPDIRHPPVRANNAAWKIVATVPNVSLGALWRLDHLPAMLGGLLVTAIICLGWSKATIARRDAEATKRTAEAELIRNERLSSLGGLVAGVAHELNTPIGNAVSVASTLSGNAKRFGAEVESGQIRRSALDAFLNGPHATRAGTRRRADPPFQAGRGRSNERAAARVSIARPGQRRRRELAAPVQARRDHPRDRDRPLPRARQLPRSVGPGADEPRTLAFTASMRAMRAR